MPFIKQFVAPKCHHLKTPDFKLCYTKEYLTIEVNKLKFNVGNIFHKRPTNLGYEDLYRLVQNLCSLGQCENMKDDLQYEIWTYLNTQRTGLLQLEEVPFLSELLNIWKDFCLSGKLMRNIYLFMEVAFTRLENVKCSVWNLCTEIFRNTILDNESIKNKLQYLFVVIDMNRHKANVDMVLVQDLVGMMDKIGLYVTYFEIPYLNHTETFYQQEQELLLNGDIVQYFHYVQVRIDEELNRVQIYFNPSTKDKVYALMFKILIEDKVAELLNKLEDVNLFDAKDIGAIITVYAQLEKLSGHNADFCKIFTSYMLAKGKNIVCDTKSEHNLILELLRFKDRIDEIVSKCFRNNELYVEAVRISFKKFINQRKYKPAQYLAKFIDLKMRDRQIPEDLLDKIIVLFRYIQGKDVFEAYYKRYLAKRLLLGKSSSQDAEKYMLSKLKVECGDEFTTKLEGMLRDIDMSENLIQAFKHRSNDNNINDNDNDHCMEFSAYILTNSYWPTFCKYKATLCDRMLNYQKTYQDFYKTTYSGRSLEWIGSLDTCLMKAQFPKGNKELHVSLYQGLILLLFNDNACISFKSIRDQLGIEDCELRRSLLSLLVTNAKILKITNPPLAPASTSGNKWSNLTDDDEFIVNEKFSHKLFRIKINQLQYKDTDEEQKITETEVMHDRHLQIDAAIVRTMKQHQRLKHNELTSKVFGELKFPISQCDIKKRIEVLIGRDFLARNVEEPNVYFYVA